MARPHANEFRDDVVAGARRAKPRGYVNVRGTRPSSSSRTHAYDGPAISAEEHESIPNAEPAVVQKEGVPVERVRLNKETVTEGQTIELDGDGDTR